jgi:hypothetical protein
VKLSIPVIGGLAFAVLFIAGLFSMSIPVGGEASSSEEIRDFYADSGDRTQVVISLYLLMFSGVAFTFFLAGLYTRIRDHAPASREMALAALIAGSAFIALVLAGAALLGSIAGGIQLGNEPELAVEDAAVARFLGHAGYGVLLIGAALSATVVILATSVSVLRDSALAAGWVAWVGFACALILLAGVIFLPMVVLPLWVILASFTVLQGNSSPATT